MYREQGMLTEWGVLRVSLCSPNVSHAQVRLRVTEAWSGHDFDQKGEDNSQKVLAQTDNDRTIERFLS